MTMGPGGGSDPGNAGRGGRGPGSTTGGGTGGGFNGRDTPGPRDGNGRGRTGGGKNTGGRDRDDRGGFNPRDTPGDPDAADGKRGSTMGPGGGTATGGGGSRDGRGTNTPSSPASRARDAMSRRDNRAADDGRRSIADEGSLVSDDTNLGIGESYSHADAITERAKTGAVTPGEMDMARGYNAGRNAEIGAQTVDSVTGMIGKAQGVPGAVTGAAVDGVTGVASGASTMSSPEASYGVSVARNRAKNTMAQNAAQIGAGLALGPVGSVGVGMANAGINAHRTADIGRMADALGLNSGQSPSNTPGGGNGGSGAHDPAVTSRPSQAQPAAQARSFEWSPVNLDRYRTGLISMARNS